jgi:DNA segregation ATPase FtsK/SpoIIIE, S-DNA-T family
MKKTKSQLYWENLTITAARFLWFSICELWSGIKNEKIDIRLYILPGTCIAAFFALRVDSVAARLFNRDWLEMSYGLRTVTVYTSLFAGWMVWAFERAYYRAKLLSKLRAAFTYCGLEANQKLPAFIEDKPIDEHVRNLKLFTRGLPVKKFTDNKENLEGFLNISIVKMRDENGDKGRINILYAMEPLQTQALLDELLSFDDGEIPIGISYEGPIKVNMRDVAHILIAGQTGGGKSNFEKVVTTVLVLNNKNADVYYLDFKGGMELADLTNRLGSDHDNFHKYEGPKACAKFLSDLGDKIEGRLKEIARLGVANLDAYQAKFLSLPSTVDEDGIAKSSDGLKRTYIVIDEIAQLYARDPSVSKEDLLKAREAVNRIARQGRAAGIHLIVATQKPDSMSFDQTVKANLPAVLCFPMANQASSVSALGTKRAFDLDPEIKGRAIWKYGPKANEVQTYLFQ